MARITEKTMLTDANGNLIAQYYDAENDEFVAMGEKQDVILKNRNVEEIIVFDALAITDTSSYISGDIDVSKYKKIFFTARNELNQPIDVAPQYGGR